MTAHLIRLRANPAKVRVSIRRYGDGWLASVTAIDRSMVTMASDDDAERAINDALYQAERRQMPGIDIDLAWAYRHPQVRLFTGDPKRLRRAHEEETSR